MTHLSRKAGRSGRGAGAELWELSISEDRPRPSGKERASSKELEEGATVSLERWEEAGGEEEGELEERREPRGPTQQSPATRRGERGGGGRARGEEEVEEEREGTRGRGEEEQEPGWERAWSRGGM